MNIMDNGSKIKKMVRESLCIKVVPNMMVNGKMMSRKEWD
jgi:hypothetical protein